MIIEINKMQQFIIKVYNFNNFHLIKKIFIIKFTNNIFFINVILINEFFYIFNLSTSKLFANLSLAKISIGKSGNLFELIFLIFCFVLIKIENFLFIIEYRFKNT